MAVLTKMQELLLIIIKKEKTIYYYCLICETIIATIYTASKILFTKYPYEETISKAKLEYS